MTARPLVGITGYLDDAAWGVWRQPAALLPHTYVEAVTRAGATAVVLPPQAAGAGDVLDRLDGLLLAGGPDVDPARYGAAPHPRTGPPHEARDAWEFGLLAGALDRDLPLLAVCRGMQVLNVALGGTLVQHLPDRVGDSAHQPAPATFGRRTVRTGPGSALRGILGPSAEVSCYHHQAVGALGAGLLPAAWSEDETVEAVELPGRTFTLGVQWHPEADAADPRLFTRFVAAVRTARADGGERADRAERAAPAQPADRAERGDRAERRDREAPAPDRPTGRDTTEHDRTTDRTGTPHRPRTAARDDRSHDRVDS